METSVEEDALRHMRTDRGRELLPVGRWALWCSLASLLPLAIMGGLYLSNFCLAGCPPAPRSLRRLITVSGFGFLAGVLVAVILSVWALVAHRQTGRAGTALLILVLLSPFVLLSLNLVKIFGPTVSW
jgi:hypothetical protein